MAAFDHNLVSRPPSMSPQRTRSSSSSVGAAVVVIAYLLGLAFLTFRASAVLVPDEGAFIFMAQQAGWLYAYQSFDLAYGGVFWILLKASDALLGAAGTKALFLAMLVSPLIAGVALARDRAKWFGLALWAGLPLAWWYGKVVSPDTLNVMLVALATVALLKGRPRLAMFTIGVAVGVKLNALALVPPAIVLVWASSSRVSLRSLFTLGLATVAGALLATPAFCIDPAGVVEMLAKYSGHNPDLWENAKLALFGGVTTWDLIPTSSLFHSPIAAAGYLLVLAAGALKRDRVMIALGVGLLTTAIVQSRANAPFGWYWFPYLSMLFVATCTAGSLTRMPKIALVAILAIFAGNAPSNVENVRTLSTHSKRLANLATYQHCVDELLSRQNPDRAFFVRSYMQLEYLIAQRHPCTARNLYGSQGSVLLVTSDDMRRKDPNGLFLVDRDAVALAQDPVLAASPPACDSHFVLFDAARK